MSGLELYKKSLISSVQHGVGHGLSIRQLADALVDNLAMVLVSSCSNRKELDIAAEVARHELDRRIVYYDNCASDPGPDRRQNAADND